MNDKILEFIRVLRKMLQFPEMSISEAETVIIKEGLRQLLDYNPNYGPQTKRDFKAMLEESKSAMTLAGELEAYIATHDVTK